jgi:carbonic anhydrase/acetyltransferase-like protein (isoleucine patch superfamily)
LKHFFQAILLKWKVIILPVLIKWGILGAGAVVVSEVPDRAVAVGNPARVIKTGGSGFNGVSV